MSAPSFTRSEMPVDDRENDSSYLSFPAEIAPDHSVIGIVTHPSNTGLFLSQGLFPEGEDWEINRWPHDIPLNPHNPQANEEAYPKYPAGPHPPIQTTPARSTNELSVSLIPHAEDFVNITHEDGDLTAIHSLSPMLRTTALPEFAPAACMPIDLAYVNIECDWHQDGTPRNIRPTQGLRYTHTDETTELSVPSILPMVPSTLAVAIGHSQEQEQRSPQDRQQGSQWAGRQSTITSSRPSRRSAGIRRDPMGRYSCDECGKSYSQPQGTRRHQRETHDTSICSICHKFEWARPYLLKNHLEKKHSDVDIDAALNEAMRTRHKVTDFTSHHRD